MPQQADRVLYGGRSRPKIQLDEVIRLYEQGYSTIELAEKFNVTPPAIWQRLKMFGKNRNKSQAQRVRRQREKGRVVSS